MGKIKTWISAILKIAVTLLVISPIYIAVVYSVKSKPELITRSVTAIFKIAEIQVFIFPIIIPPP